MTIKDFNFYIVICFMSMFPCLLALLFIIFKFPLLFFPTGTFYFTNMILLSEHTPLIYIVSIIIYTMLITGFVLLSVPKTRIENKIRITGKVLMIIPALYDISCGIYTLAASELSYSFTDLLLYLTGIFLPNVILIALIVLFYEEWHFKSKHKKDDVTT